MPKPRVRVYTDYKSPYAFVANKRLFELEETHGVELEWRPYTLRVAEFMGTVEERTPHFLAQGALRLYGRAALCQCARACHERAPTDLRRFPF
ncbi:2-hydroxychromene-2-carboxylate isomerase [Bradyrhizobium sp. LB9.1b]